MLVDCFFDVA
jgi:hypothetical protein